ncbi:MAG: glycosyltransferase family 2 protein [Paludibacteraceae bacterium]|nr:glycosyltransferase family 2 protein [Paludibacteraceae bacterium]
MFISIIIPLYNKQNSIAATLQSVLAQTYTNYEIIVVDDGSTDDSANVAETVLQASRLSPLAFRLIKKNNGGVSSARNRGIQEAKYDYIALLDGDDLWDEHYLEEQVKLIQDFPEAKMWGINFAEMSHGKLIRKLPTGLPEGYRGYVENYFQMPGRISDLYCSSSVVIRKEVFEKVGYFDERIKYAEDNDMWFRVIAKYQVVFYDRYMAFYKFDAENRILNKPIVLKYFLPYYADKYHDFKDNRVFYTWINRWAANHLRKYYFEEIAGQRLDANVGAKKLDYSVIPPKYRFLYGMPYPIACVLNKLDKWYHKR